MSSTTKTGAVRNWHRRDQVHRALLAVGEPVTSGDLASLMDERSNIVYAALRTLMDKGWAEMTGSRPARHGGRAEVLFALSDEGRDNVPDPTPHSEVGHSKSAPSTRPADGTDFRNYGHVAEVDGETHRSGSWPVLVRLRSRDTVRTRLRETAALLDAADPLREELLKRASEMSTLSPAEDEYLRFATWAESRAKGAA